MTIILFDIDGTLTPSGEIIKQDMMQIIEKLSQLENVSLGLVGGGNAEKITWQMGSAIEYFKYIFSECGAVVQIDGIVVKEKNMLDYCNREVLNTIIKKALFVISEMPIIYHGNQIDFRKGLIYISPPGIQATTHERSFFLEADKKLHLRENLLVELKKVNKDDLFEITYGGAVGVGVCLKGWNKSQIVGFMMDNNIYDKIYYFGDRCDPDGNDYPLYSHELVNGVAVKDYEDTINNINGLFFS